MRNDDADRREREWHEIFASETWDSTNEGAGELRAVCMCRGLTHIAFDATYHSLTIERPYHVVSGELTAISPPGWDNVMQRLRAWARKWL